MYLTGSRAAKSLEGKTLASKKVSNPFSILSFLFQIILLAIFAFASVIFITKFGV